MIIGCHLSVSKGFAAMGRQALSIGANTFQFFTRNPRGGKAKEIDEQDVIELKRIMKENNFGQILAHAPYTLSPCSKDEKTRKFALNTMIDDLKRMEYLPGNLYNFHPGSHVGLGVDKGIELISNQLNLVLNDDIHTTVLLETMAGKGCEVGAKFEELKAIIDNTKLNDKLGVCLDTCHIFDAGYDIVEKLDDVLNEFDRVIGINRLKAVHLNDSMNYLGCHKDRHQKIGLGAIGIEAFERIINHEYIRNLPFYLETPNELDGYAHEIKILKELYKH